MNEYTVKGSNNAVADNESIPLWKALAQYTSDDLDTGLDANAKTIKRMAGEFRKARSIHSIVSFGFGALCCISLAALVIGALAGREADYFLSSLAVFSAVVALLPRVLRQIDQYGFKRPDRAVPLPYDTNKYFEGFLRQLQSEAGPKAYYFSRFGDKRKYLERREFFGKLRYLLFSEHAEDRRLVMRFRTGRSLPSDIFIDRHDLDRMRVVRDVKPKAPAGTKPKYPYEEAIIAVLEDPEVKDINLRHRSKALSKIQDMMVDCINRNPDVTDPNCRKSLPRVQDCSEKIYSVLKNLLGG